MSRPKTHPLKGLVIVQFEDPEIPYTTYVWVIGQLTKYDWLEWIGNNPYSNYDSFGDYVEAFMDSTGKEYGFINPDLINTL